MGLVYSGVQRWTGTDPIALLPVKTILPKPKNTSGLGFSDIPYVVPANDNLLTKDRLSARCGNLLRRLIALHGLRQWPAVLNL